MSVVQGVGGSGARRMWLVGLFATPAGAMVALLDAGQRREVWAGMPGESMEAHTVTAQRVMRDGGSTEYVTSAGALFVPGESRPEKEATWRGEPVTPVELSAYAVDLAAQSVLVTR